ncbi:hypothetical protein BDB01DRAFT_724192 [Pilobolus umbonatus]|nr:hypothetical protein BDB01DRAFT_724192 [Pilobolus umbonatus]
MSKQEEEDFCQRLLPKRHIYDITESQIRQMARISGSSMQLSQNLVSKYFGTKLGQKEVDAFKKVFNLLNTRPGTYLLTGYWGVFSDFDLPTREKIMNSWKSSSLTIFRSIYRAISGMIVSTAYSNTKSPLLDCLGYDALAGDKYMINHSLYEPVHHDRLPMMSFSESTVPNLSFDVIVVGSGAGGGVAAAELASAGYSVLVIEKGKYYHQDDFSHEEEHYYDLCENGGIVPSTNSLIQSISGSLYGGGTSINYLASFKPQHYVRDEWNNLGLPYFKSPQFDTDLCRVFDRIGATTKHHVDSNLRHKFFDGCRKLGFPVDDVNVNTGPRAHLCNRCMLGCKAGIKQSTVHTWLIDALQNGARFMEKTQVTKVLVKNGKAVGVECIVNNTQKVNISAKRVIVCASSLRTPDILKKSGLKNSNIGKHLHLQPLSLNCAIFDEPIRQHEGPLITCVSSVAENWNGDNYGAKIEDCILQPGHFAAGLPWTTSAEHKEMVLKRHATAMSITVTRDMDSVGDVYVDEDDKVKFNYKLSKHDYQSCSEGTKRAMQIFCASGARELFSSMLHISPFKFKEDEESRVDNKRFIQWLQTFDKPVQEGTLSLSTVHQLGSCRMGISPKTSVVKPTGETWEVKDLYVADGSVFPTAVGVNPMVTIETVAISIAREVIHSLRNTPKL